MKKIAVIMILMFFVNRFALVDYISQPDPVIDREIENSECVTQDMWNLETNKHFASIKVHISYSCAINFITKISFVIICYLFITIFPYLIHMNEIYVMRTHAP